MDFALTLKPGDDVGARIQAAMQPSDCSRVMGPARPFVPDREAEDRCGGCGYHRCRCAELDSTYEREAYPWR